MKRTISLVTILLFVSLCLSSETARQVGSNDELTNMTISGSSPETVLDAAFAQIQRYEDAGTDVPKHLYDFYFQVERKVLPEVYQLPEERDQEGGLDQLGFTCPGTIIDLPEEGELQLQTFGQTNSSANNCRYPDCRNGRDVVAQLNVPTFGAITITTCGSSFDTYLCLYESECCGEEGSTLIASNNNSPFLCNGQRLASGIQGCIDAGTYYIVLDGAGPAAFGSYALNIYFTDFCD